MFYVHDKGSGYRPAVDFAFSVMRADVINRVPSPSTTIRRPLNIVKALLFINGVDSHRWNIAVKEMLE